MVSAFSLSLSLPPSFSHSSQIQPMSQLHPQAAPLLPWPWKGQGQGKCNRDYMWLAKKKKKKNYHRALYRQILLTHALYHGAACLLMTRGLHLANFCHRTVGGSSLISTEAMYGLPIRRQATPALSLLLLGLCFCPLRDGGLITQVQTLPGCVQLCLLPLPQTWPWSHGRLSLLSFTSLGPGKSILGDAANDPTFTCQGASLSVVQSFYCTSLSQRTRKILWCFLLLRIYPNSSWSPAENCPWYIGFFMLMSLANYKQLLKISRLCSEKSSCLSFRLPFGLGVRWPLKHFSN